MTERFWGYLGSSGEIAGSSSSLRSKKPMTEKKEGDSLAGITVLPRRKLDIRVLRPPLAKKRFSMNSTFEPNQAAGPLSPRRVFCAKRETKMSHRRFISAIDVSTGQSMELFLLRSPS